MTPTTYVPPPIDNMLAQARDRLAQVGVECEEDLWADVQRWALDVRHSIVLEPWLVIRCYLRLLGDRVCPYPRANHPENGGL